MRALLATGGVILGMALLSGLLEGCASPATPAGIAPTTFDVTARHAASVSVAVTGGRSTGDLDAPQISNEAFAEALTGAIERSGVFSSVADGSRADYRLAVQIFRVQPPLMGFAMPAIDRVRLHCDDERRHCWRDAKPDGCRRRRSGEHQARRCRIVPVAFGARREIDLARSSVGARTERAILAGAPGFEPGKWRNCSSAARRICSMPRTRSMREAE